MLNNPAPGTLPIYSLAPPKVHPGIPWTALIFDKKKAAPKEPPADPQKMRQVY
jgi:hypothetical protein